MRSNPWKWTESISPDWPSQPFCVCGRKYPTMAEWAGPTVGGMTNGEMCWPPIERNYNSSLSPTLLALWIWISFQRLGKISIFGRAPFRKETEGKSKSGKEHFFTLIPTSDKARIQWRFLEVRKLSHNVFDETWPLDVELKWSPHRSADFHSLTQIGRITIRITAGRKVDQAIKVFAG